MIAFLIFIAILLPFILLALKSNKHIERNPDNIETKNDAQYLNSIEEARGIVLPEIYKRFFISCSGNIPWNLVGTDLFNSFPDLNEGAVQLLNENKIENFLTADDFVFMMHQGYMFWYFRADGNPDPIVFYYLEQELKSKKSGCFSEFIKEYLPDI